MAHLVASTYQGDSRMRFSVKGAVALAFCLCLALQHSADAQLFSRTRASGPINPPVKLRSVDNQTKSSTKSSNANLRNSSKVTQAFDVQQAGSKKKAADVLASYNSFEPLGQEGIESSGDDYTSAKSNGEYYEGSEYIGEGFTEYDTFDSGSCNVCLDDCCGEGSGGRGLMNRPGQFFLSGEYIYARANFSEALAYVVLDPFQPLNGLQVVEYDFDYKSSYRFSGGYRFSDCGGEIVFNYARYRGEADFFVQDTSGSPNVTIFGPYEVNAPGDDGILTGAADVDVKSYDLGVSRTIPLGSPLGCCAPCCDTCCDDTCCTDTCCDDTCCTDCCGGWCPAWDITWSAGVRFAEAGWSRANTSFESDFQNEVAYANTRLDFEGAGARVGLLGRRYFGRRGRVSAYAKGDFSLLVGDMSIQTITIDDPDGSAPLTAISHSNTGRRMIPVTEIEAGLAARVGNHLQFSSGYFLSAWHDLGFRDEYNFLGPGGGGFQLLMYDDANILAFDGFFARAEVTY